MKVIGTRIGIFTKSLMANVKNSFSIYLSSLPQMLNTPNRNKDIMLWVGQMQSGGCSSPLLSEMIYLG
jgi:hypothetical protein